MLYLSNHLYCLIEEVCVSHYLKKTPSISFFLSRTSYTIKYRLRSSLLIFKITFDFNIIQNKIYKNKVEYYNWVKGKRIYVKFENRSGLVKEPFTNSPQIKV